MSRKGVACCLAVVTLLVADACWLTLAGAGQRFTAMAQGIGPLCPWPWLQLGAFATAVYLLLALAVCRFAVLPAQSSGDALRSGALLGLVIYGVYDATNLCLFGQGYGVGLAAADVGRGTFALGLSSWVGASYLLW